MTQEQEYDEILQKQGSRWRETLGMDVAASREWLTMDTAPKDGTVIDLWAEERVTDCYWGERSADEAQRKHFGFEKIGWCRGGDDTWVWPVIDPTHWVPLPTTPA